MNCETCLNHIYDYVDNELEDSQKRELETHLENCAACRSELTKIDQAMSAYHAWGVNANISSDFVEGVLANLDEAQRTPAFPVMKLVGFGMISSLTLLAVLIGPVLYSLISVWFGLLFDLLRLPGMLLSAFPTTQTVSMAVLGLMMAGMTLAMRHLIKD